MKARVKFMVSACFIKNLLPFSTNSKHSLIYLAPRAEQKLASGRGSGSSCVCNEAGLVVDVAHQESHQLLDLILASLCMCAYRIIALKVHHISGL